MLTVLLGNIGVASNTIDCVSNMLTCYAKYCLKLKHTLTFYENANIAVTKDLGKQGESISKGIMSKFVRQNPDHPILSVTFRWLFSNITRLFGDVLWMFW